MIAWVLTVVVLVASITTVEVRRRRRERRIESRLSGLYDIEDRL